MGSGSTVAAAEAQGLACLGVERFLEYFKMSVEAIPLLAHTAISPDLTQLSLLDDLGI
jgi:site-specific DNA-methyltransferase (adenine-specific)